MEIVLSPLLLLKISLLLIEIATNLRCESLSAGNEKYFRKIGENGELLEFCFVVRKF